MDEYYGTMKIKSEDELSREWRACTHADYDSMLGAVPPLRFQGNAFLCGEALTHGKEGAIHAAYIWIGDETYCRPAYVQHFDPQTYRDQIAAQIKAGGILTGTITDAARRPSDYGFIVLPSERYDPNSIFSESPIGTKFVAVEINRVVGPRIVAMFYYRSNFAKHNTATEDELRARFPLSFNKGDVHDAYTKFREGQF